MATSEESIRLKIINKGGLSLKRRNYIKYLYEYEDDNKKQILIENILIEYFGIKSLTTFQSENFIKFSNLDIFKTNLNQLIFDIGIILKVNNGIDLVKDNYKKEITMEICDENAEKFLVKDNYKKEMCFQSSGKCEFDELYGDFKMQFCKFN